MTQSNHPPSVPDDNLPYGEMEDSSLDDREDDEDSSSSGSSGDGGGSGRSPNSVHRDVLDSPILTFDELLSLTEDENAIEKLRKLWLAPMSLIASGATAFAAENDLSRKVFMAEVGLFNREISSRDIANSNFIRNLDEKQARRRVYFGIKTLDEMISGAAGAIGSAGAAISAVVASTKDYIHDKREERKLERLAQKFELGVEETYALDPSDGSEADESMKVADFPVLDNQAEDVSQRMRIFQGQALALDDDIADRLEAARRAMRGLDKTDVTAIFNIVADIMANDPVKKKDKAQMGLEASGAEIAPGTDKSFSPTGD